ncbi:MAG: hypothetical protein PHO84_07460 [Dysgonamonadaceae bacterium]|nr:hypothetical protein [Dysgonamonadaceae bacterium]MDD3727794.1 hypothetical protein [Dysgonamonadaceae bacterium]MDD4246975.1 hypothetical protein [Dysgonamonadaceae bacterium]MDD4606348.1 hypothetical protein [Dysgonamonadaceae bacterium]
MNQSVRRFKRNIVESRFTPFVITLLAIFMRLGLFLTTEIQPLEHSSSFIWHLLSPFFSNPWISLGASTISIFIIANTISQLNLRFSLIRFRTTLPFSLLVFLFSVHPLFLPMSPDYVSVIFILFAFFPLLHSYQHHSPRNFAFKSGVLIGLAATFQVYAILLLPLWWYGEVSMHGFRIKSFFALVIGSILVFWNVAGLYFIFDDLQSFITPFTYFEKIELLLPHFSLMKWNGIGLLVLLSAIFLFADIKIFKRERVLTHKTLSFVVLIITSSFILNFIYWRETQFFVYTIIALISFIVAHYYSHISSNWQVYSFVVVFFVLLLLYIIHLIGYPLFL